MSKILHCRYCGFEATTQEEESTIELHHIVPKFMGGTDQDGRIAFCRNKRCKAHDIIHFKTAAIIWQFVPIEKRKECIEKVKAYTNYYRKY